MNKIKKGLGRGLSSLIGETKVETKTNKLPLGEIQPNKFQPRKNFDEESLNDLTNSSFVFSSEINFNFQGMIKGIKLIEETKNPIIDLDFLAAKNNESLFNKVPSTSKTTIIN